MIRLLNALMCSHGNAVARTLLVAVVVFLPTLTGMTQIHAQPLPAAKVKPGSQEHHGGQALTVKELSHRAEIIAVGRISDVRSEWDETKSRIRTITTIEVKEVLKGSVATRLLAIVTPGGEVGDVGELYTHTPRFVKEEEACVFVTPDGKGNHRIVGGDRGKLTITTNKRSGRKMVGEMLSLDDFRVRLSGYIKEEQSRK